MFTLQIPNKVFESRDHVFQGRQDVMYWTLIRAFSPIHFLIWMRSKIRRIFLSGGCVDLRVGEILFDVSLTKVQSVVHQTCFHSEGKHNIGK